MICVFIGLNDQAQLLCQPELTVMLLKIFFSQQRGIHRGANTNPDYLIKYKTTNAIILGQTFLSKKRNSLGPGHGAIFLQTTAIKRQALEDNSQRNQVHTKKISIH